MSMKRFRVFKRIRCFKRGNKGNNVKQGEKDEGKREINTVMRLYGNEGKK